MTWQYTRCAQGWEIRDDENAIVAVLPSAESESIAREIVAAHNAVETARADLEDEASWIASVATDHKICLVEAVARLEAHKAFLKRAGVWEWR